MSNKATDVLHRDLIFPESSSVCGSDAESEDLVVLLYTTFLKIIYLILEDVEFPYGIINKAQSICNAFERTFRVDIPKAPHDSVPNNSAIWCRFITRSSGCGHYGWCINQSLVLGLVQQYVLKGPKPKGPVIEKNWFQSHVPVSPPIWETCTKARDLASIVYVMWHWAKSVILPTVYYQAALQMLHE